MAQPLRSPAEISESCAAIVSEIARQTGGPPTLGEFMEILGWAIPDHESISVAPLKFKARLKGDKAYAHSPSSRVGELSDSVFVDAMDFVTLVAESVVARPLSAADLAAGVCQVLQVGEVQFADVRGSDILVLSADGPKQVKRTKVGDVLAIPAKAGGHHLAVVVARNRFGTALGLFRGTFAIPRASRALEVIRRCVHTDDQQVARGRWIVVGNDESLLALFPHKPEIYHGPEPEFPGVDTGDHGAAETADGALRLIDEQEAREAGLLDGTYRQAYLSVHLEKMLDDGRVG